MAREPILVFDLVGPMAHFRKFYSNSSSLSYLLPPRTALMGIIAALLGYPRDTYYQEFDSENARIGVTIQSPLRTLMQTVNYVLTETEYSGWDGSKGPTQIPIEFVLPRPPERWVRYRVYFAHADPSTTEELHEQLQSRIYRYPLYLGLTECPAWTEDPRLYAPERIEWIDNPSGSLEVRSAIPAERVVGLPSLEALAGKKLLKDRMPLDFNPDRRLKAAVEVLWEAQGQPIPIRATGQLFRLPNEPHYNAFLER